MRNDFITVSPEEVGIASRSVLDFIGTLDSYGMHTHSILMSRGDKIFAECYYKPFDEKFLHRMYSVSKSFVAIAVGVAVTEGLIGLDDSIIEYFPEFRNDNVDEYYERCTVRDMLMMRSNIGTGVNWWGKFSSRIEAYYTQKTDKLSGTLFKYDSIGSFLLGCIIEKLTGKNFLEYLKEKVLLELGFSKESYVLREPGGYAIGDSGVMCTTRDLLIFARLIMRGGEWGGKQYVDRGFMEDAIKKQVHNDYAGGYDLYNSGGYGYLIWKTHPDGFSLIGMGDQLAICDMKKDIAFIITSDNQVDKASRHIIFHEFYRHFLPKVTDTPLKKNEAEYNRLTKYLNSRELVSQSGEESSPIANEVFGVKYTKKKGELDVAAFTLYEDALEIERGGVCHRLEYGLKKNKKTEFSFGTRARADMMGIYEDGKYDCNVSGAWVSDDTFAILAQITDTYFGTLTVHIAFLGDEASVRIQRSGQYVFEDIGGFLIAEKIKKEI
ncbi:MAG: serine hydrolase [Ruminococcaceae bacterium]|nr:serine hydrolase [Oscillospiraceae bacterium]